jgi:FimV-like protein
MLLFPFINGNAQTIATLIHRADSLEKVPNEQAALLLLLKVLSKDSTQVYALTKASELYSRIGKRQQNTKTAERYYHNAIELAEKALKLSPQNDEAHVSMAIALGRLGMTKSGKAKVQSAKDIKTHADAALAINPKNFKAWHILGKWHYEVSGLNFMEKAALKLLYGGMPASSIQEAINAYKKARELTPNFMLNYLELAKAYYRNGNKTEALENLQKVISMKQFTEDDAEIQEEAKALLKKYKS